MKKKGIGFRIITMAVVISGVAAAIGCIGLYTTKQVSGLAKNMYNKSVLRVQYAQDIKIAILNGRSILLDANTTGRTEEQTEASKKQFSNGFTSFNDAVANYETTDINSAEKKALLQTVKESGKEFGEKGLNVFNFIEKNDLIGADKYLKTIIVPIQTEKLEPSVEKLVTEQISDAQVAYDQSITIASLSVTVIIAAILIGLAVSLTLAMMITRSITKPVTKMVNSLSDSSSQIGISSTQLSTASQEIANGAQEQASSIEETTSSMEELSSMVKQNLGNTRQASLLSEKATEASQNGFDKMTS
ncbi:MAG: MCP four helix bundle domain-containing protein, partial [Treponema sp.]